MMFSAFLFWCLKLDKHRNTYEWQYKLTYVVQILNGIDGLISISDRQTKETIDLDQFVMQTTERGRNADEYIREMRDNDRL